MLREVQLLKLHKEIAPRQSRGCINLIVLCIAIAEYCTSKSCERGGVPVGGQRALLVIIRASPPITLSEPAETI